MTDIPHPVPERMNSHSYSDMNSGKSEAERLLNLGDFQVVNYTYYTKLTMEGISRIKMF